MTRDRLSADERFEILDLFARYNHTFEAGDGEGWAECFTPDGEFSGPAGTARGAADLADLCRRTAKRFPVALHLTDHHLFELEGDVLHHRCILSVQFPGDDGVETLLLRYRDTLVRVDGAWRFRSRSVDPAEGPRPA